MAIKDELDFHLNGNINDETMISLGNMAAVNIIILGKLENKGDYIDFIINST